MRMLLANGFFDVSVDYHCLCPEAALARGPVIDGRDAFLYLGVSRYGGEEYHESELRRIGY